MQKTHPQQAEGNNRKETLYQFLEKHIGKGVILNCQDSKSDPKKINIFIKADGDRKNITSNLNGLFGAEAIKDRGVKNISKDRTHYYVYTLNLDKLSAITAKFEDNLDACIQQILEYKKSSAALYPTNEEIIEAIQTELIKEYEIINGCQIYAPRTENPFEIQITVDARNFEKRKIFKHIFDDLRVDLQQSEKTYTYRKTTDNDTTLYILDARKIRRHFKSAADLKLHILTKLEAYYSSKQSEAMQQRQQLLLPNNVANQLQKLATARIINDYESDESGTIFTLEMAKRPGSTRVSEVKKIFNDALKSGEIAENQYAIYYLHTDRIDQETLNEKVDDLIYRWKNRNTHTGKLAASRPAGLEHDRPSDSPSSYETNSDEEENMITIESMGSILDKLQVNHIIQSFRTSATYGNTMKIYTIDNDFSELEAIFGNALTNKSSANISPPHVSINISSLNDLMTAEQLTKVIDDFITLKTLKRDITKELDQYISLAKKVINPLVKALCCCCCGTFGHNHDGRARAIKKEINKADSIDDIGKILNNQKALFDDKTPPSYISSLKKWSTQLKNEGKGGYYRAINEGLTKIANINP